MMKFAILALLVQGTVAADTFIATQTVNELLESFSHEIPGQKPQLWRAEAKTLISMVQKMSGEKPDAAKQGQINALVDQIIAMLQVDIDNTKTSQGAARDELTDGETQGKSRFAELVAQLNVVKTQSANAAACRSNWTNMNTTFYHGRPFTLPLIAPCSDNDRPAAMPCTDPALNCPSAPCPSECGKPSAHQFELTSLAKQIWTCNFELQPTPDSAQICIDRLRAEVNKTRANLTAQHSVWLSEKNSCEAHLARCGRCEPKWSAIITEGSNCENIKDMLFNEYCALTVDQKEYCDAEAHMAHQWSSQGPAQTARKGEYDDLKFLICIFEAYKTSGTFTQDALDTCKNNNYGFYPFAGGQIYELTIDASTAPSCTGATTHESGSVLWDLSGFVHETERQGITNRLVNDAAGIHSVAKTILTVNKGIYSPAKAEICPR